MDKIKIGLAATGDPQHLDERSIDGFISLSETHHAEVLVEDEGFFTRQEAEKIAEKFVKANVDMVVVLCQSFTWFGECIIPFSNINVPIAVWAIPEPTATGALPFNSMTGLNLFTSVIYQYLKREDRKIKWLYGKPDSEIFKKRFVVTLEAAKVIKNFCSKKYALIGGSAEGFVNLKFHKQVLEHRFNITIEEIGIQDVFDRMNSYDDHEVEDIKEEILVNAVSCTADEQRIIVSCKAIKALEEIYYENNYAGMAVSCWSEFQNVMDIFPCMAFGYLIHKGITIGCEGDLLGMLSMKMLDIITGNKAALMDMVQARPESQSIMWWHCGLGIMEEADEQGYNICEYASMPGMPQDPGVIYDMILRPAKVTVFRLLEDGEKMFALSAQRVRGEDAGHTGVRGWYKNFAMQSVPVSVEEFMETIAKHGIPHHYAIASGDAEGILLEAAKWLNLEIVEKEEYHDYL